ncbi:MAG: PIN domain-containing protein [Thermoflexaceae bacterium]|nr:PIN domain-containing protein [Thermoflexaceae bacterium]
MIADPLVVDASVWVAAADATDPACTASRSFLRHAGARGRTIILPAYARIEIACALARRLGDSGAGLGLAGEIMQAPQVRVEALSAGLIAEAARLGTAAFLRAGDALYAAVAQRHSATLVAWDAELVSRAGAIAPDSWLERQA